MADRRTGLSLGLILCLIPAAYFIMTTGYALLNAAQFASDTARLLRYVVGPGVIALGLIAAGFLMREDRAQTVGISALSILAALFLVEAFLTTRALSGQMGLIANVDEEIGPEHAVRANLPPGYTVKRVNAELGVETLDQAVLSNQPFSSVLLCSNDRNAVTYETDRYGFRNPDSVHDEPTSLLILGDSFVEGICLPDGEDFASQIRARVPGTVALGTRGSGTVFQLALLGRYGPDMRPPVTVIVFFAGNDWDNLTGEKHTNWLDDVFVPGTDFGPAVLQPARFDAAEKVIASWWNEREPPVGELFRSRAMVRNFAALHQTALLLGLHYPAGTADQPVFAQALDRAKNLVAEWDGALVLAYISPIDRYAGLLDTGFVHDPLRSRVVDAADAVGVDVIDLTLAFDAAENPMSLYAPDSHFSPTGANLAAETVVAQIRSSGLLPSP